MKNTINKPTEVEITHVKISVHVRYDEEQIPKNFPLRRGDIWEALVNIDTGVISGWPQGKPAEMHLKVCDGGTYTLLSPSGEVLAAIENDYVPNALIPGEYGNYIHLIIDATGKITNWPGKPDVSEFDL